MKAWGITILLTIMLAVGCTVPVRVLVKNPEPIEPVPERYEEWYHEVEECLHQAGDYKSITWYWGDGVRFTWKDIEGIWLGDAIMLHRDTYREEWLVKHEAIHHILNRIGHNTPYFEVCTDG